MRCSKNPIRQGFQSFLKGTRDRKKGDYNVGINKIGKGNDRINDNNETVEQQNERRTR